MISAFAFGLTMFAGLWLWFWVTFGMCFGHPQRCSGATDPSRPMLFVPFFFAVIGVNLAVLIYLETTRRTAGNVKRRLIISALALVFGAVLAVAINPIMVRLTIYDRGRKLDNLGYEIVVPPTSTENGYGYVLDFRETSSHLYYGDDPEGLRRYQESLDRDLTIRSNYSSWGKYDGGYISMTGQEYTDKLRTKYTVPSCQNMLIPKLSFDVRYTVLECKKPNSLGTGTLETQKQGEEEMRFYTYYVYGSTFLDIEGSNFTNSADFDHALKRYVDSLGPISQSDRDEIIHNKI